MGSSSSAAHHAGTAPAQQSTNYPPQSTNNNNKNGVYNAHQDQPRKNTMEQNERSKPEKQTKSRGVKENSAGFPTPMLLATAQRKYSADHRGSKPKLDKDGIPLPFPPPTMKAEVFNPSNFKSIDRHAQKASLDLAAKGYPELVAYLIKPAQNDVGKVRAFFVWIASQRLQQVLDYVGSNMPGTDKPLFLVVLTLVRQWGNGYSELFESLCKAAGIPCRVVKGRVKGSGYRLGEKTRGTNDYCMVLVDGAWRFVDQHWGSQFVMGGVDNDEWELVHDTDKEGNNVNPQGDGWDYICDDFYFLTDPEALVYTHLAVEPECQLLARPVTEEEYWQMAHLKDAFFELEMTMISQPKCLIQTNDGIVVFEFGLNMKRHCSFSYAMYKSLNDPSLNLIDGVSIEQYVMMETISNSLRITINFPCIGRFKFNLYGRDLDSKVGFTAVCEYAITCNKPNFTSEPNPENTRGEWGPGAEVTVLNIDPLNNDGGIIYAKDGRAEVRWKLNGDQQLLFQNRLKNPAEPKENLNSCIRHYKTDNDAVFLMKLPHKGRYVLQLFVNDATKDKKFTSVCNYLVISDVGCFDPSPYPPCDNKLSQTGDVTSERGALRVTPISHKDPILDPYNKGDMNIQMVSSQEGGELHAQLQKYYENDTEGKTVEDCSDYVNLHQNQKNIDITAQFPQVGFYKLDVLSRNRPVYQYLINVQTPNVKATPFPEPGPAWRAEYQIMEPRNGLLQTGQKVHVVVNVPGATQVKAVGQTTSTNLTCRKKGSDIWEGDVTTESRDGTLKIVSDAAGGGKSNQLFIYKVLNKDGAKEVTQRQEAAQHEAELYKKEVEQQKLTKANDARKKQKEAQDKARLAEEDFKKNESKYRSREAQIQKREQEEELKDADLNEPNEEEEKRLANKADQKADLLAMLQKRDKQLTPRLSQQPRMARDKGSEERSRRDEKYLPPITGRSQGGNPQYGEYLNEEDNYRRFSDELKQSLTQD